MVDAFNDRKVSGINIFRFFERIHQYHGNKIWWCPLKQAIEQQSGEKTVEWIRRVHQRIEPLVEDSKASVAEENVVKFMQHMFAFKDNCKMDVVELFSSEFLTRVLKLLLRIPIDTDPASVTPIDVVNFECFYDPVLIREKVKSNNGQIQGVPIQVSSYQPQQFDNMQFPNDQPPPNYQMQGFSNFPPNFQNGAPNYQPPAFNNQGVPPDAIISTGPREGEGLSAYNLPTVYTPPPQAQFAPVGTVNQETASITKGVANDLKLSVKTAPLNPNLKLTLTDDRKKNFLKESQINLLHYCKREEFVTPAEPTVDDDESESKEEKN